MPEQDEETRKQIIENATRDLESSANKAAGKPVELSKGGFPKYKNDKREGKLKKYIVMGDEVTLRGQSYTYGQEVELTPDEFKGHQERGIPLRDPDAKQRVSHTGPVAVNDPEPPEAA